MKIIIFSLFLPLQLLFSQSQIDTSEYFPLQTGNHWEYASLDLESHTYIFDTIIGDTLMANGKTYKILKETYSDFNDVHYWFYRNDSNIVYTYSGIIDSTKCPEREYIEYDFTTPDSVIWPICFNSFGAEYKSCINTLIEFYSIFVAEAEIKEFVYVIPSVCDTIWSPLSTDIIDISKYRGVIRKMGETFYYVLNGAIINGQTFGTLVGVKDKITVPLAYSLLQNFPNPFNPSTTIKYSLAKEGNVNLTVYNSIGSKVATIVEGYKPAGNYSVQFNGSKFASGIYLYRLESGNYSAAKKFVILK
jgi:hypothetical protein